MRLEENKSRARKINASNRMGKLKEIWTSDGRRALSRNRVQKYRLDVRVHVQGGEPSCNILTGNILAH
jgi:hypothetical protein